MYNILAIRPATAEGFTFMYYELHKRKKGGGGEATEVFNPPARITKVKSTMSPQVPVRVLYMTLSLGTYLPTYVVFASVSCLRGECLPQIGMYVWRYI